MPPPAAASACGRTPQAFAPCSGASGIEGGVPPGRDRRGFVFDALTFSCRWRRASAATSASVSPPNVARDAVRRDAAVLDHIDVVGDCQRALDVLVDEQDRLAGVARERRDELVDGLAGARIDARGRLVDEIDRRLGHQAARDLDLALLAAGELAGRLVALLARHREARIGLFELAPQLRLGHARMQSPSLRFDSTVRCGKRLGRCGR